MRAAEFAVVEALEWLPQRVRNERVRRGLSLREAAEQIPYAFADLCRFENGAKDVRISTAIAMLRWACTPAQIDGSGTAS